VMDVAMFHATGRFEYRWATTLKSRGQDVPKLRG
jgi:hypothetical protein